MRTFYFHAGLPKTGSTALQLFCFENRVRLMNSNLYYVNSGTNRYPQNHFDLFPIKKPIWEKLVDEISKYGQGDLLCSHEGMIFLMLSSGNIDDEFKKMRSYLPDYQIRFITYIRRIDDMKRSLYNQRLKAIDWWTSQESKVIHLDDKTIQNIKNMKSLQYAFWFNNPDRDPLLLLSQQADNFIHFFGEENFILKIYDRNQLKNGNVIDDFFHTIGIDISDITHKDQPKNEKIPDISLPLYQILYSNGIPWESESIRTIRNKIFRLYSLPQGSDAGKFVNQAKTDSLIERLDSLCPGYKALFADRKCDFSFPEIDFDPKDRLLFDLLFSMYAQQHDLHARQHGLCESLPRLENEIHSPSFKNGIVSAITDSEAYTTSLKNAMISVLYPNFLQRLVLQVFRLFYRLTRKREVYHHFRHRNVDFISRPDRYPSKILRQILRIFGSIPPIQR